jgi:hypothetical protein
VAETAPRARFLLLGGSSHRASLTDPSVSTAAAIVLEAGMTAALLVRVFAFVSSERRARWDAARDRPPADGDHLSTQREPGTRVRRRQRPVDLPRVAMRRRARRRAALAPLLDPAV